jgi:hypothetical protein
MNEVEWSGTVATRPTYFRGRRTHAVHEQFDVRRDDGRTFRVIDNVDLAPRVPVLPGDRVTVRGELVAADRPVPIVHWTHHDPRGAHPAGWIEHGGRRYGRTGPPGASTSAADVGALRPPCA